MVAGRMSVFDWCQLYGINRGKVIPALVDKHRGEVSVLRAANSL